MLDTIQYTLRDSESSYLTLDQSAVAQSLLETCALSRVCTAPETVCRNLIHAASFQKPINVHCSLPVCASVTQSKTFRLITPLTKTSSVVRPSKQIILSHETIVSSKQNNLNGLPCAISSVHAGWSEPSTLAYVHGHVTPKSIANAEGAASPQRMTTLLSSRNETNVIDRSPAGNSIVVGRL